MLITEIIGIVMSFIIHFFSVTFQNILTHILLFNNKNNKNKVFFCLLCLLRFFFVTERDFLIKIRFLCILLLRIKERTRCTKSSQNLTHWVCLFYVLYYYPLEDVGCSLQKVSLFQQNLSMLH